MNEYNVTQYCIPENTLVMFSPMSEERRIIIKLLSGSLLYNNTGDRLPLEEYELPLTESLYPQLRSKTPCDFILRGNPYMIHAMTLMTEINRKMLFQVSQFEDSSFFMEKNTQLQIFVTEDDESDVSITCSEGNCQIFGSRDDAEYSVRVSGIKRRIKVSLTEDRILGCMRSVRHLIQIECSLAKKIGPTFLVVGPTNTGKTSFCRSLLNGAIYDGMNPIYINLDIRRCIPGTISLREIIRRMDFVVGFAHHFEIVLHFGNVVFNSNTIQLYYLLVRKMGELLTLHQSCKDASRSPTIIDMCGMLGQDKRTIECVLQSFTVKQIIYIGNDRNEYENLTKALPLTVETEFLTAPENIEPPK